MQIEPPKFRTSQPERDLQCQESIEGAMQEIIIDAYMMGWGTVETMNAMEEVLRNLRLFYSEGPGSRGIAEQDHEPSSDWPAATP